MGPHDDEAGQVAGEALVEEGFLTVGIVAGHGHHRAQIDGREFRLERCEDPRLIRVVGAGEDDTDIG